ncbi:MAG TPA: LamG-like jellyroll fold domain-containing protein [Tepidisphaeraceae bacterium]|nr:LamG-like jellyroll fold domain-containing protein [Tepidisphaeraceae bacterium]
MAIAVTCEHCGVRLRFKAQHAGKQAKCRACGALVTVQGQTIPDHDVFVSYSHRDKPIADAICGAMESKRVRCWIAPRDILPGKPWAGAILDAIGDARLMVLIYSANSNSSPQVLREVDRAVSREVPIIPFRIDRTELSKEMEYYIAAAHWLDAYDGETEEHVVRLVDTARRLLATEAAPTVLPQRSAPVAPPTRPWLAGISIGLSVLAIVSIVILAWSSNRASRPAPAPVPSIASTSSPQPAAPPAGEPSPAQLRQQFIAQLLSTAKANDDPQHGRDALAALDEALMLDPANAEAIALRRKISSYYASPTDATATTMPTAAELDGRRKILVAQLIQTARENDSPAAGRDALAALDEALMLDPGNPDALSLHQEISAYYLRPPTPAAVPGSQSPVGAQTPPPAPANADNVIFQDSFDGPPSTQWSNSVGDWTTSNGCYFATQPRGRPATYTGLPFDLTDFTVDVDIKNVGDGGLWLRSDGSDQNGVLLVTGGLGYGDGQRGNGAGGALYWHVYQNGRHADPISVANGVFVPDTNCHIHVVVRGDHYAAFINGATTPASEFVDDTYSHGQVGLYDNQPSIGGGSGERQMFANFTLSRLTPADTTSPPPNDLARGLALFFSGSSPPIDGVVKDESGNGNDGHIQGARWIRDADGRGAFSFSAARGSDVILVPDNSSLDVDQITQYAWVKTTRADDYWHRIIDKNWQAGFDLNIGGLWHGRETFQGRVGNELEIASPTGKDSYLATDNRVTDGVWHQVAGTYDGTTMKVYVDGVEKSAKNATPGGIEVNQDDLRIGNGATLLPDGVTPEILAFDGEIRDVRIFNRALSADEIAALGRIDAAPPAPALQRPLVFTSTFMFPYYQTANLAGQDHWVSQDPRCEDSAKIVNDDSGNQLVIDGQQSCLIGRLYRCIFRRLISCDPVQEKTPFVSVSGDVRLDVGAEPSQVPNKEADVILEDPRLYGHGFCGIGFDDDGAVYAQDWSDTRRYSHGETSSFNQWHHFRMDFDFRNRMTRFYDNGKYFGALPFRGGTANTIGSVMLYLHVTRPDDVEFWVKNLSVVASAQPLAISEPGAPAAGN